jgi:hypothetical protein
MKRKIKFRELIPEIILGIFSTLAVVVSLIDLFSDFINLNSDTQMSILITLSSAIILYLIIERYSELIRIRELLQDDEFEYIAETKDVIKNLSSITQEAKEFLYSIGAKSTAEDYLAEIELKNMENFQYRRLLTGDHITKELHDHLLTIRKNGEIDVKIAWIKSEKYGQMTITENGVIIALPSPYKKEFKGIKIIGDNDARHYIQYFLDAFSEGIEIVTDDGIKCLLDSNEYGVSRNDYKIERFLLNELEKNS